MFDVVVVGAGISGLSCAIRIQQAGARVAVVTADEPGQTVSAVAAAVWYPSHTDADPRVLGWAASTFEQLSEQAAQGVPGVVMRPTRMLLRGSTISPWWARAVPDFRHAPTTEVPSGHTGEWRFTVPSVEMAPYLDWQLQQLTTAGGVVFRRRLDRLSDVTELAPTVVNATGLAARILADDPAVHPIRGRIVLVANPGLDTSVRDEDDPAGLTYVHPRSRDVVLGGTFEPDEPDLSPSLDEGRAIIERCTALVPRLAGAQVLRQVVGLRPGRDGGIRLEQDAAVGPQFGRLIHNYGHGGAGVTLSWGCADEVARLAASS
jgi:D-amino-acid oxidase